LHLIPFDYKYRDFRYHLFASPKAELNFYIDIFGNILLFIPFAFILFLVFNIKSGKKIILISLLTSICIETIQFLLGIGVADIDDVILNTIGACIGVLLLKFLPRLKNPLINKVLYTD
jgi:glycopeptide antibiotics resistance protein